MHVRVPLEFNISNQFVVIRPIIRIFRIVRHIGWYLGFGFAYLSGSGLDFPLTCLPNNEPLVYYLFVDVALGVQLVKFFRQVSDTKFVLFGVDRVIL